MDLLGRARIKILSAQIDFAKMFCDCFFINFFVFFFYFSFLFLFYFFFFLFFFVFPFFLLCFFFVYLFFLTLIHGDNRTTSKKDGNAAQEDPKQPHN